MADQSRKGLILERRRMAHTLCTNTKPAIKRAASVALALAASGASAAFAAGNHHICYQEYNDASRLTLVAQCRSDTPGVYCEIQQITAMNYHPWTPPPVGNSVVRKFVAYGSGLHQVEIAFSDGTRRECSTYLRTGGAPNQGAYDATPPELIGYTTDASGLVTTGVWSSRTRNPDTIKSNRITVPGDFVVVGGGAAGTNAPYGAFVSQAYPDDSYVGYGRATRDWKVETRHSVVYEPHTNTAYAIGMKIEGVDDRTLNKLVAMTSAASAYTEQHPKASVYAPASTRVLGGGTMASVHGYSPTGFGQNLTASAPLDNRLFRCVPAFFVPPQPCAPLKLTGWHGASKEHGDYYPGGLNVWVIHMPETITVLTPKGMRNYNVETTVRTTRSLVEGQPSTTTPGVSGEYALTAAGALVDWWRTGSAGNLLWKLAPRGDIAGAEVASKDHVWSSPSAISGYAVGVKLVPAP